METLSPEGEISYFHRPQKHEVFVHTAGAEHATEDLARVCERLSIGHPVPLEEGECCGGCFHDLTHKFMEVFTVTLEIIIRVVKA